jgi:hypothetical protein
VLEFQSIFSFLLLPKTPKLKKNRHIFCIILNVLLYGCEAEFLSWEENVHFRIVQVRGCWQYFDIRKRYQGSRKLHNEERNLYTSPYTRAMKSRSMRWVEHAAGTRKRPLGTSKTIGGFICFRMLSRGRLLRTPKGTFGLHKNAGSCLTNWMTLDSSAASI